MCATPASRYSRMRKYFPSNGAGWVGFVQCARALVRRAVRHTRLNGDRDEHVLSPNKKRRSSWNSCAAFAGGTRTSLLRLKQVYECFRGSSIPPFSLVLTDLGPQSIGAPEGGTRAYCQTIYSGTS